MISLNALSFGFICLLCFLFGVGLGAGITAISITMDKLNLEDLDS